ncbi:MAG: LacI family DNA-binding transcriptional regulator [Phycisphaerae bacterium]|nr:LacI family DNA-binding transcriptional regulator [Phycisphaerae bacterium]
MKSELTPLITLKMIADEVGVTHSTVSAVLNDRASERRVGKKTQRRVLEVARRLNYQPNYLARGLVGKRTKTIGLIMPSGMYFPQYLLPQEISLLLHKKGYQTYLTTSLHDKEVFLNSLAELSARRVDGVIFFPYHNHYLTPAIRQALRQFPVTVLLAFESIFRDTLQAHLVCVKMDQGAEEMVAHFAQTGRRRPLMVTSVGPSNEAKVKAFKNALERHGYDSSDEAALYGVPPIASNDLDSYTHFLRDFESRKLRDRTFDALFCTCDEGAIAAMNYLKQRGIRVPEDVAVVGLNDMPLIRGFQPSVASISWRHPIACELIVTRLVERLNQTGLEPGCDELPTQFIRRESAG